MKYEVLKGCVIDGKPHRKGEVVEVKSNAWHLLAIGRIAPYSEPVQIENRAVALEVSQDKPRTRRKK